MCFEPTTTRLRAQGSDWTDGILGSWRTTNGPWAATLGFHRPFSPPAHDDAAASPPPHHIRRGASQNVRPPRAPEQTRSDSGGPPVSEVVLGAPPSTPSGPASRRLWQAVSLPFVGVARYLRLFLFWISVAWASSCVFLSRRLCDYRQKYPPFRVFFVDTCDFSSILQYNLLIWGPLFWTPPNRSLRPELLRFQFLGNPDVFLKPRVLDLGLALQIPVACQHCLLWSVVQRKS